MVKLMARHSSHPKAFTLVEMLVVLLVIAIILAIAIPAMGKVRDSARAVKCSSNLKQLGAEIAIFIEVPKNKNSLPYFVTDLPASPPVGRLEFRDVFPDELFADTVYCPSDKYADSRIDSSYYYEPGQYMQRESELGNTTPAAAVTRWYRQFHYYPVLYDREPWHKQKRNIIFGPDWRIQTE